MTGTPVVYPDTPGAIAQKFFIGDADGTVWRFDLTDTNPQNWTGLLYLDPYNKTVDTSPTAWADGQPIQIPIVVATDLLGAVVVGIGTGDQETYTTTGTNYVYSVTEKPDPVPNLLRANVNWYVPYTNGERVSGPMTIFNNTLYWSTFAESSGGNVCSGGTAKMWGRDYELLSRRPISLRAALRGCSLPWRRRPYLRSSSSRRRYDPTLVGKLIPGVSVNVTPACADTSQTVTDQYTGGVHTMANYVTPGSYSLFAQVGGKNASGNGAANSTFTVSLPSPTTSAVVDSWAAIVE